MPRIRTVKPEFWGDEKLAPAVPLTRLVFLGLISMADDAGRLTDNVKAIDGFLFPETDDTARASLDELAGAGRILRYTSRSGQKLIQIANWSRHQKVDHAAKYVLPGPDGTEPSPDEPPSRDPRENGATPSRSDQRPATSDLRSATSESDQASQRGSATDAARLAALRGRLLEQRYGSAPPDRRAAVLAQLDAAVTSEGTKLKRGIVVRTTPAVLARAIEHALAEEIRDPDKTIVVVLQKALDGKANLELDARGRTATEAMQASDRAQRQREEQAERVTDIEQRGWLDAHPDEAAAIERQLDAELGRPSSANGAAITRAWRKRGLVDEAMARERELAHAG